MARGIAVFKGEKKIRQKQIAELTDNERDEILEAIALGYGSNRAARRAAKSKKGRKSDRAMG